MSDTAEPSAPEPNKPAWKKLATRKIWVLPVWAYVLIAFIVIGAFSGGGDTTDDQTATEPAATAEPTVAPTAEPEPTVAPTVAPTAEPAAPEPTAEPAEPTAEPEPTAAPALAAFSDRDWEGKIDTIVASDDSPIAKGDAVVALAREYSMTSTDIEDQIAYLVEQVRTRSIVDRAEDKPFMFRLMFVARSVERAINSLDDPDRSEEEGFAYDAYQIARDLAREVETPDSSFIEANLEQLDDAIASGLGPEQAVFAPCTYLGPDDFGDMHVDLSFTNEFSAPSDIRITYGILDSDGIRFHTDDKLIDVALPGERMHINVDTLDDEPASVSGDDGITCEILEIAESNFGSPPELPDPDDNSCRFVEVDSFGDIQVEIEVQNPFDETADLFIEYALYADMVRFDDGFAAIDFVGAGERLREQDDSLTGLPDWASAGANVTCQILAIR